MYTWFVDNSLPSTEYWTVYNVHSFVLQNNKILVEVDKTHWGEGSKQWDVLQQGCRQVISNPGGTQRENIKRMNSLGFKVLDIRNFKFIRIPRDWDWTEETLSLLEYPECGMKIRVCDI